jgi:nicotinate-nucleotide pyrophosphorylase (carboxylating)
MLGQRFRPASEQIRAEVQHALTEDIGSGDVTAALVPAAQRVAGNVLCREAAVLCGTDWFDAVFAALSADVSVRWAHRDGDAVAASARLCELEGPARAILTGERTALNFLQTLSATATAASRFAQAVAGTRCTILDTRKTLPGMRLAQKYASTCGGAANHRLGLYDMVLIKENHIVAAGSIEAAVSGARRLSPGIPVEVEVESLSEFDRALVAGADIIMLDELSTADLREAVRRRDDARPDCRLEASGSVTLDTVRSIAETGVDFISIGAITKHVRAVDLSMRLTFSGGD